MTAVLASLFSAPMGRPVETERWADAVDRWQYGDPVPLEYSIGWLTCTVASRLDAVMLG
jgi:hypothetical protein